MMNFVKFSNFLVISYWKTFKLSGDKIGCENEYWSIISAHLPSALQVSVILMQKTPFYN